MESDAQAKTSSSVCGMKGCDEEAIKGRLCGGPCECGFKICRDCYLECGGKNGGGKCPGCKEPYKYVSDDDEDDEEEDEDQPLPLPSMAEFKLDKRLSVVKSFKTQNHPPDFDHTRWLFETKGTYGYGNAVWPKDGCGANGFEPPPEFGEKARRPLTRKVGVSAAIISPYRSVTSNLKPFHLFFSAFFLTFFNILNCCNIFVVIIHIVDKCGRCGQNCCQIVF